MNRTLIPAPLKGRIKAIPSKSYAHRLLICAALAKESIAIRCPGSSRDIQATAACLQAMGAGIQLTQDGFSVTPGAIPPKGLLPCGESGSTLRFLLPVAAALGMEASFLMEGRLPERPLAPLDAQLEAHGIKLERPQPNLLRCSGKLRKTSLTTIPFLSTAAWWQWTVRHICSPQRAVPENPPIPHCGAMCSAAAR